MTQPFRCPQCGYRNYVTADDLDRERIEASKAMRSMERRRIRYNFWAKICGRKPLPSVEKGK